MLQRFNCNPGVLLPQMPYNSFWNQFRLSLHLLSYSERQPSLAPILFLWSGPAGEGTGACWGPGPSVSCPSFLREKQRVSKQPVRTTGRKAGGVPPHAGLGVPHFLAVQTLWCFQKAFFFRCYLSGEGVENLRPQDSSLPDGAELTQKAGGEFIATWLLVVHLRVWGKHTSFNWAGDEGQQRGMQGALTATWGNRFSSCHWLAYIFGGITSPQEAQDLESFSLVVLTVCCPRLYGILTSRQVWVRFSMGSTHKRPFPELNISETFGLFSYWLCELEKLLHLFFTSVCSSELGIRCVLAS